MFLLHIFISIVSLVVVWAFKDLQMLLLDLSYDEYSNAMGMLVFINLIIGVVVFYGIGNHPELVSIMTLFHGILTSFIAAFLRLVYLKLSNISKTITNNIERSQLEKNSSKKNVEITYTKNK